MSPSVMTRMPSSDVRLPEASTSSSSSVSIDEQLSATASSSLLVMDLPDRLDDCVKQTFLLGFSAAVMHSALRDLTTIREAVLGPDRIKQLVDEGCSPEMIGTMIASKKELMDGFKSVEGHVRDLALGFCLVQVASQFDTVSLSDEPSIDAIRLRRFQKMVQDMKVDAPKRCIEFSKIDYAPLYKYLEEERFNGSLTGDPAWEDARKSKKYLSWQEYLAKSLQKLETAFRQAADEVDWSASSQMDADLLQAMPASSLISLTLNNYESAALRLNSGPLALGNDNKTAVADAESLSQLGRDFRSDLLDHSKHLANSKFKAGCFDVAEVLYDRALTAGSNDASVPINRAAALLKLSRFDEAQECCTIGLTQLEIAEKALQRKGRNASRAQLSASQRSRPMLTSKETLDELRWKAYVRRGRAHKGILTQLGGLSSESGVDSYLEGLEDEEAERAERRGQMLLAARSDFASALQIDPLDDVPRQEMASLTIHPLQRRSSGQNNGLALASIIEVDREQRRMSQEAVVKPAMSRRSISDRN